MYTLYAQFKNKLMGVPDLFVLFIPPLSSFFHVFSFFFYSLSLYTFPLCLPLSCSICELRRRNSNQNKQPQGKPDFGQNGKLKCSE
jgi:hypothetical protein